jgi:hypothetical protein
MRTAWHMQAQRRSCGDMSGATPGRWRHSDGGKDLRRSQISCTGGERQVGRHWNRQNWGRQRLRVSRGPQSDECWQRDQAMAISMRTTYGSHTTRRWDARAAAEKRTASTSGRAAGSPPSGHRALSSDSCEQREEQDGWQLRRWNVVGPQAGWGGQLAAACPSPNAGEPNESCRRLADTNNGAHAQRSFLSFFLSFSTSSFLSFPFLRLLSFPFLFLLLISFPFLFLLLPFSRVSHTA